MSSSPMRHDAHRGTTHAVRFAAEQVVSFSSRLYTKIM
jgi:hypothetical protein